MLHRNQLEERTHRGAEDGTSLSQAKNMVKPGLSTHTETRGPQVDRGTTRITMVDTQPSHAHTGNFTTWPGKKDQSPPPGGKAAAAHGETDPDTQSWGKSHASYCSLSLSLRLRGALGQAWAAAASTDGCGHHCRACHRYGEPEPQSSPSRHRWGQKGCGRQSQRQRGAPAAH